MKAHSIERRIVTAVISVQLALAICVTVSAFLYERHAQFHSLDIALRGRADSLFGAVQEADDTTDNVLLVVNDLRIPRGDVFVVREADGKILGASSNLKDPASLPSNGPQGRFTTSINGQEYRGIRLQAVRTIDPKTENVRHTLSIIYATQTAKAWDAIYGALRFFALINLALLLLTTWLVSFLVRRSMQPLGELAGAAGRISAPRWSFTAPESTRKTKELAPLVAAIEGVVQRLELSFSQQRQFLGDAAHELKTAVAVIKSSLQLLSMRPRTVAEYQEGVLRSETDCSRMEELVGRMLALARIEAAKPEMTGEILASSTVLLNGIHAAMEQLHPIVEILQVDVDATGSSALAATIAPELWQTLCTNVLLNAIQYSSPDSTVTVILGMAGNQDNQMVQCVIADKGQGIPPDSLPHVFHRFYRGDPSRSRASGGAGLGLAICQAIAEQAGGSISIDSSPGLGTTVTILLPLAVTPNPVEAVPA
jgi:signal transduction histidine kinase